MGETGKINDRHSGNRSLVAIIRNPIEGVAPSSAVFFHHRVTEDTEKNINSKRIPGPHFARPGMMDLDDSRIDFHTILFLSHG